MAQSFKSPFIIAKLCITVLGIVIMGVGLHSHFNSSWWKVERSGVKPHKICDAGHGFVGNQIILPGFGTINFGKTDPCPDIAMEQYYVAIVIITFVLSIGSLVAAFFVDGRSKVVKTIDVLYHGIAAVLLLIAAIVYIVSAAQIKALHINVFVQFRNISIKFLYGEKIAAGVLTILQSVFYCLTAIILSRQQYEPNHSDVKM